ncbi:MAG TPA: hypothetical protein VEY09_12310 [Pyrinomonadaceae bacterium]|nr:hypothetical protein [Pyrinomonadaceae bacterium]
MYERIIELEDDSLEAARDRLNKQNVIVLREFVLCSGETAVVEAAASTVEEAAAKAARHIPPGARLASSTREVKASPRRIVLRVEADSEEEAGQWRAEAIESVSLHRKGRKGFLGFGRAPNVYEVVVAQPAVVELRFRERARICAVVRGYAAEDLLRTVAELRRREAPWEEAARLLNPENDADITSFLTQLRELSPASELDDIEGSCRRHEEFGWRQVIEGACRQAHERVRVARARELKEQEIRLRRLDRELAEVFRFYTCVQWDERNYQKVTGIPRYDWDQNRAPDERDRESVPRYSADPKAFASVETRVRAAAGLYELYKQSLQDEGLDEATATLEQKCVASLKARRARR